MIVAVAGVVARRIVVAGPEHSADILIGQTFVDIVAVADAVRCVSFLTLAARRAVGVHTVCKRTAVPSGRQQALVYIDASAI